MWIIKLLPWFFRASTNGKNVAVTGKGSAVGIVLVAVAAWFLWHTMTDKWQQYLDDKDESRKVQAVIDSSKKQDDIRKEFKEVTDDALDKVGTDAVYDLIN